MADQVQVDANSVLARFADWNAQLKGRPVGAFGPQTREATLFVEDEVLVDGADEGLIRSLVVCKGLGFSLRALDAGEDLVGVLGPGKRPGVIVPAVCERAYGGGQLAG